VSNGRFSGQEQAITSRSGDPHDLWKTLWVTRPTGPETREFRRSGLGCSKMRQKNNIENQALA
jgi:hypothetical protein